MGTKGGLEERIEKFDGLASAVRDFPESPEYKILKAGLIDRATSYLKNAKGELQAEISIDENKARQMAKDFWGFLSQYVAKHYLKWTDGEIDAKKTTNDPASGKPVFETVITDIVGVDEDGIYNTLKTRGSVTAEQVPTLVSAIYESHDRRDTTKRTGKEIKDNADADAALKYVRVLKSEFPKALAPLNVPTAYRSVEEVQGLIASAARAVPRDSRINVADTYRKAA